MRSEQAANLAWALVEAAKPHMTVGERNYVFVTVGAGDTFAAVRSLIKLIAAKHIPLRRQLAQQCSTWLDGYAFHTDHEHLSRIIDGFLVPRLIQAPVVIRRVPTTPNTPAPLAVTAAFRRSRRPAAR